MTTLPAAVPLPLPLRLPRLTRNEAHARSLLAQRARARDVKLGGQAWQLTLQPMPQDAPSALGADDWQLRADWAGAPFELRLPAAAGDAWLRARFPGVDLPPLPHPLRTAALETALQDALAALQAARRGPARIESLTSGSEPDAALPHRFAVALAQGEQVLHGTLATNSFGLMLMAGLVATVAPAGGAVDADTLPILLRAEIGATTLPASQVASLRPGDAVLLADHWTSQAGELWLGHAGCGLRVRWEDTRLVVTQPLQARETPMAADTEPVPPAAGTPVALDHLPVRLVFDLGERSLTLGELKALQVGQALELARPLSQAVNIRANGALIGLGELIEIDGKLGVSIVSLGPAADQGSA